MLRKPMSFLASGVFCLALGRVAGCAQIKTEEAYIQDPTDPEGTVPWAKCWQSQACTVAHS